MIKKGNKRLFDKENKETQIVYKMSNPITNYKIADGTVNNKSK